MNKLYRLLSPPSVLLAVVLLLTLVQRSIAQSDTSQKAVRWEFSAERGSDGKPVLVLHAQMLEGWRLYSTTMPDSLPNSRVALDSSAKATIAGVEEQGKLQTIKEPLFDNALTRSYAGETRWIVKLSPGSRTAPGAEGRGQSDGSTPPDLKGTVTFMAIYKDSIIGPTEVPFRYGYAPDGSLVAKSTELHEATAASGNLKLTSIDLANPVNKCGGTGAEASRGLLQIFILGFLGGLIGLIMPCTFPMIPLTVSFFTKRAATRSQGIAHAFLYGFFIFLIYVLISVPFYFLKQNDSNILNTISTSVGLNIFFGAIFIAFALSFFGLFEITLPSSLSNSVDAKSNIGSVGGIFFMALTLAIVSFSCTGPILGTLLVNALSQTGGAVQLSVAMAGFGLALGLPFALFALFPNWLQSLPRSGSWMNTVKIVFGFIELALALKYLSNADLVTHWGLLKRETFFAIWIVIGACLVLYLFGIIKFHHDPPPAKLSAGRKVIGLLFLAFVLYLLPGLTNTRYANIALVSGFPPPLTYSLYGAASAGKGVEANVVNDFNKALQLAKAQHKPILIDFTGWACVNCRKMEENVWPKPGVRDLISKDYILVSLYVDDRKQLPDDQQFLFTTGDGSKKAIRTVGDKFATLQSENFSNASQPFYVLISPDEKLLTKPVGYTPDPQAYAQWLSCGLDAFKASEAKTAGR
ncbi:MAG TPA: cytochrome c biogenesis protein CcdA [Puia sp.]|nr:cytochrome c biogenesis protein CcdA [Puia sp.]